VRDLPLPLPPDRMPLLRGGRPLKRWRYVGVFGPELMLCAAEAFVGPFATRYWGVVLPDGTLLSSRSLVGSAGLSFEGSRVRIDGRARPGPGSYGGRVSLEVELDEPAGPPGVESVSSNGAGGYLWTRKCAGVPARGVVTIDGVPHPFEAEAVIDDSAGYHPRHTVWRWSAGVGRAVGGERVGWSLVEGINDDPLGSERTLWVDGSPGEVGPTSIAAGLDRIRFDDGGELSFRARATLAHRTRLVLLRSDYRQPFGDFAGTLPGGLVLAEGFGVTESHDAWW